MRSRLWIRSGFCWLLLSASALAHPLGDFTVNTYTRLHLETERVTVRLVVDFAEIATAQQSARIDLDRDGTLSKAELRSFAKATAADVPKRLTLAADGAPRPLHVRGTRAETLEGQGQLPTLRVEMDLAATVPAEARRFVFENRLYAERIGWNELWVSAAAGQTIYDSSIFGSAVTDELRDYPEQSIGAPLNERRGRFSRIAGDIPPGGRPLMRRDRHLAATLSATNWLQAALRFVDLGFRHILEGIDHILFLLCLVIPVSRFVSLIGVVTSFTVAHSITLLAAPYDLVPSAAWFSPFVETLIALSIVFMAVENIVTGGGRRRWILTFLFGLVHGIGFSFALRETLQLAGPHLLASLVSFNIGVELGQLLLLALMIQLLRALRWAVPKRTATVLLSAAVALIGWHWSIGRGEQLGQLQTFWPGFDAALFASAMRWLTMIAITAGLFWLVQNGRRHRLQRLER